MNESELHWFWNLTSKWWFFPVFYVTITFLTYLNVYDKNDYELWVFLLFLLLLPAGLIFYIDTILQFFNLSDIVYWELPMLSALIFHIFLIISIFFIFYFRSRKNKILKILIITLIILILLSFYTITFTSFFTGVIGL